MTEVLCLTLRGPLASWGEIAVGRVRPSGDKPTRSALLGLLAGMLGIRRDEAAKLMHLTTALHPDLGGPAMRQAFEKL